MQDFIVLCLTVLLGIVVGSLVVVIIETRMMK